MAQRTIVPLSLETIDNGKFLPRVNAAISEACGNLVTYMREHGDKAKKAKATLDVKIVIQCENPDPTSEACSVKATHRLTTPAQPPALLQGNGDETQTGELTLLVPFIEQPDDQKQQHFNLKQRKPDDGKE